MSKFINIGYKTIMIILMILFLYITIVSAFYGINNNLSPIVVILGTIVTFFLFKYLNKKINNLSDKKIKIMAIILSIIFFIGLLLIGIFLPISSVTDLSHIIEYVNRMISENSLTITGPYFSKYTNQIPLLIFVYGFTKIGSIFNCNNVVLMGTIFNALFISITAYFIYLIGKEIKSPKAGLLALVFMIINPIFYLYTSYFYTDTLCMPFAIIGLYLIIKSIKSENKINKIILAILSGFIFFIGLKIRIVVIILLIASFLFIFINKQILHKIKIYLALFLGLIIGLLGFKIIENSFTIDLDKNASFPITHWLMMGLNEEYTGGYNEPDHTLTFNENSYEEKKEANIKEIKTRIKELGPIGIIKLEGMKIARTWSSGNYGVYAKLNNTSDGTGIYEYLGGYGNTNIFLKYTLQILKTYISLMIFIGLYQISRKKKIEYDYDSIIYIALFGAIVFYILWEAAQRYSLSFLPWMIIPLGLIYSNLSSLKIPNNKLINKLNYNKKSVLKILSIILMLITITLLTINFNKYALETKKYEDVRILSYRGFSTIEIADNTISQSFTAKDTFNQIKINFTNSHEEYKSIYLFELYNSNNELLYQEKFNSNEIKNNGNYKFKFNDISKGNNYRISITKLEGTSVLSIKTDDEGKYYQAYNNGSIYINNQKETGTFVFRVDELTNRTYMSIISYLILVIFILGIEWFSLKEYIVSKDKDKVKDLRKKI